MGLGMLNAGEKSNERVERSLSYSYVFSSIKETKGFIFLSFLLFANAIILSFVYKPEFLLLRVQEFISRILEITEGMNFLQLFLFIFQNNLKTSFLVLIGGVALGIFPFLNLIANGYLIGIVSQWSVESSGIHILLRLLPHGIFEFPAFLIAASFGLKIGTFIFAKNKGMALLEELEKGLTVFLLLIVPLLLIAAFIETLFIVLT